MRLVGSIDQSPLTFHDSIAAADAAIGMHGR